MSYMYYLNFDVTALDGKGLSERSRANSRSKLSMRAADARHSCRFRRLTSKIDGTMSRMKHLRAKRELKNGLVPRIGNRKSCSFVKTHSKLERSIFLFRKCFLPSRMDRNACANLEAVPRSSQPLHPIQRLRRLRTLYPTSRSMGRKLATLLWSCLSYISSVPLALSFATLLSAFSHRLEGLDVGNHSSWSGPRLPSWLLVLCAMRSFDLCGRRS
ncbi:hypothetical protein PsorP6_015181 [Peronosclerospora sorghi]|uniref:Uncharacterized protein n=1 Tax=Peronosclerospora sorghi TaxID=230839 RepID=A0ACC0VSR3_9STRA|nr:hypothetical protein PsorP6_015181 [Peronosclerospora sorghi]